MKVVLLGTSAATSLHCHRLLIEKCIQEKHQVYVLYADYTDSTQNDVRSLGATPIDSPLSPSMINPVRALMEFVQLKQVLSAIKPDMLLSFFAKPVIFGVLAAKLAGVKHIYAMLEKIGDYSTKRPESDSIKTRLIHASMNLLYRLSLPFAKSLIILNQHDAREFTNVYHIQHKTTYVLGGLGVDPHQFIYTPPTQNIVHFLFVKHLLCEKGIGEFIAAAKSVKKQFPSIRFTVIGNMNPENPISLNAADKRSLSEQKIIHFKAYKNDVLQDYIQASVLVLPSYQEGGVVSHHIQEAMNVGRAVITASVTGNVDIIHDGRTGFILPSFDAQAIEKKMIYFIMNPEKVRELGYNAHSYAKRYLNSTIQTRKLYKYLIQDHAS